MSRGDENDAVKGKSARKRERRREKAKWKRHGERRIVTKEGRKGMDESFSFA